MDKKQFMEKKERYDDDYCREWYHNEPRDIKEKKIKVTGYPAPHPHKIARKEEFFSEVSKKKIKPDPATVEAELQREEDLWNS
jgi:hypothetical protein